MGTFPPLTPPDEPIFRKNCPLAVGFRWFSLVFVGFRWFSLVFVRFRWFSLIGILGGVSPGARPQNPQKPLVFHRFRRFAAVRQVFHISKGVLSLKTPPRRPPHTPRTPPDAPRSPKDAPNTSPGRPQDASRPRRRPQNVARTAWRRPYDASRAHPEATRRQSQTERDRQKLPRRVQDISRTTP